MNIELKERSRDDLLEIISAKDMKITMQKIEIEETKEEIERLNNIMNDIDRYIHNWRLEDIGEKTMLILNDILLIKNGMSDEVIRLKGEDKE